MQRTENYGLAMPEQNDFYNVDDFNENSYVIDEHLKFAEDTANDAFHLNDLPKMMHRSTKRNIKICRQCR